MARRTKRPPVTRHVDLRPERRACSACGGSLWAAYEHYRTVTTLDTVCRLTVTIVRCHNPQCPRYRIAYRPEEEEAWALPHHEFGLDVIARIGSLRYRYHRSVPEIHQAVRDQGVAIAPRTVCNLLARYEELLALRLADHTHLTERLTAQGQVILAIDGLQPDKHEDVLWVLRDCLSGEVLLARSLDSMRTDDLAVLLREVKTALPVPIRAVVSDAQRPIRLAVREVLPGVPHQLCQFHYLKEAGCPLGAADYCGRLSGEDRPQALCAGRARPRTHHQPRGRRGRGRVHGYCVAVRTALADNGTPPLQLPGLLLYDRLQAIQASLDRVLEKKEGQRRWSGCARWWALACLPPRGDGNRCARQLAGSGTWRRCWRTRREQTGRRWRQRCIGCSQTSCCTKPIRNSVRGRRTCTG